MASKNLAADIKAYNQKVSSGQKTEPTTKYNTPSQQGRTAQSYTRQNIADQKSNRENSEQKKAQQGRESAQQKAQQEQSGRNYLAEAQEGGKQQEQEEKSFLQEAQEGRQSAENSSQKKTFMEEANPFLDGGEKKITKQERDELAGKYQQAVAREQETAGYITDPFDIEGNAIRQEREQYENQLKAANQQLGLDTYTDLTEEARARDRIEGFQGERAGQYGAGLGIIADYVGEKTGMQGLERWGEGAREGGRTVYNESQEDWANSLEGRPGIAGTAAGVAKSAGNVAEDMVVNFLTGGIGGRVLMGLRAAGSGALTQEGREKNDTDSVFAKAMLDTGSALLSNKLLGALGGAYGKSALGPKFSDLFKGITNPNVRRAVANTEGFEEGLEFGIDYIGDRLLGLDGASRNPLDKEFWQDWSWGEFSENVILGYFLGTIFNGISGGEEYNADRIKAVADEAIEAAQSGLTFDEIADIARETTKDQVVIKPGKHEAGANVETEADVNPETESYDANDIVSEFNEQQGAEVHTPTEPNADTRARVETILANADAEQRGLAPGEIRQILEDPAALNAYAEATGTTARQARTDLENRLNGAPDTTGTEAMNDRYQNADTAWDRFWNAANEGPEALARLIAEDPDNMTEYMKYYEQATGETMSNDPDELWRQLQDLSNDSQQGFTAETTAENNANGMPRNEGNGQTGQSQGQNNATQNPFFNNGNQQQNNNDTSAPGTGKEKTSQFFSKNLTRREGADVRSPLTYLTKTEADTLQNAMNRLNMNGDAEMATMMASTMWSDEQVKMGKIIGQNLLNEARTTGDWNAYDAWRKVEREHATAIARALRAYGRDPDAEINAEGIAKMAANYFSMLRDDIRAAQESGGKLTQGIDVDLETIDAAQAAVTNATNILGDIETEEANLRNQGFSDEEIFGRVKDRYLDIAQEIIAKQYGGFILDDITGKNADVRDGVEEATTILRNLLATESPEYIRNYVKAVIGGITTDVQYMGRPTAAQRAKQVSSIQKLCQLFALGTTKRNLLGNATFGLFDWASNNTAGALADSVLSLFTGQRTRGLETGVFGGRNYKNAFEAARRSALEIAANLDMKDDGKYISGTSAFSKYDVGGRFMAKANQLLGYALNTTDAAFVGFNEQSASDAALRANGRRGGEMTEETAQKIGENEAEYRTFKNTTATQKAVEAIKNVLDLIGWGGEVTHFQGTNIPNGRKGGFGLGTYIAPYIGVPVNLGLKIAEYSPIGAAKGAVEAGQAIKGARNAGDNAQDLQDAMVMQNKASGDIGRGLFGTAVVLLLKSLMKQAREEGTEWFKDWNLEKDSAIKAQNNAEGKSGQQVNRSMLQRILNGEPAGKWENGDDLVNMSAIEPMNQTIALASLLADDEHSSSFSDYLKALGTATVDSLQDLPAIASLTQIADTINYNKEYDTTYEENEDGELVENREVNWGRTLGNAGLATIGKSASGFIPAPVRHAASIQDEYQRDTRGDNAAETAWNQVVNSIPTVEVGGRTFGRGSLPVKMDAFGNPVTQGDKETRKKNAFNALKYTQVNQTPESEEINRLYEETGKSFMQSSSAPRTVTYGSGDKKRTVELTADEGRSFVQEKNKNYEKNVSSLINDTVYPDVDKSLQTGLMGEVEKYTKDAAKAKLADEKGVDFKSRYEGVSDLDDPIGYIGVNKGFNLADSAGKYDVVDMLIPEIQGMSKADRDFLRKKNSTAMNYYDFLTPNAYGYKVGSAETVHDYKQTAKDNAEKRGVTSASGGDKFNAIYNGFYDKTYSPNDVLALMTKQASDGDYDVTKGRAAVFLAAFNGGKSISESLQIAKSADINNDGTVAEKGSYKKAEKEGSKTLRKNGVSKDGLDVFYDIMYPNKK